MKRKKTQFNVKDLAALDPDLREKIEGLNPKEAHELLTSILGDKEIVDAVSKSNKKKHKKLDADIF